MRKPLLFSHCLRKYGTIILKERRLLRDLSLSSIQTGRPGPSQREAQHLRCLQLGLLSFVFLSTTVAEHHHRSHQFPHNFPLILADNSRNTAVYNKFNQNRNVFMVIVQSTMKLKKKSNPCRTYSTNMHTYTLTHIYTHVHTYRRTYVCVCA